MGGPGCCDRRSWCGLCCLNCHCCPKHGPHACQDEGLAVVPALIGLGLAAGLLGLAAAIALIGLAAVALICLAAGLLTA